MADILLLDCSEDLLTRLQRQGFDVSAGTVGFCTGVRQLPSQLYENDVVIYNPATFAAPQEGVYLDRRDIQDLTPEYDISMLEECIINGGICLVFVNRVAGNLGKQREAFGWIPYMPEIDFTKDSKPLIAQQNVYSRPYLSILNVDDLKNPVLQKLVPPEPLMPGTRSDIVTLFYNRMHDVLGVLIRRGQGQLVVLPEFASNEKAIEIFLRRVLPKLLESDARSTLINQFLSPGERSAQQRIEKAEKEMLKAEELLQQTKEERAEANRLKVDAIRKDETAVLVLKYYDQAVADGEHALFHLYKILDALKKKFGNVAKAKKLLRCSTEWNSLAEAANASHGDTRHAPEPGEKVRDLTPEKVKSCFEDAEKIVRAYLEYLF